MKRLIPAIWLGFSLAAQATPNTPVFENMDALLVEKGVVTRLGEQLQGARDRLDQATSSLVITAMGLLGVPYKWGGDSAEEGFDCSGLVRAVFEQSVGKILPRRAAEQAAATQTIDRSDLQPGDLVFFNTLRRAFSHVGIYVGDGQFIHSPRPGSRVRLEDMRLSYWTTRFDGARRVPLPISAEHSASAPH